MSDPRLTPLAASLPASVPFVGPETHERRMGRRFDARIGANESTFGPSPRAVEAMAEAAREAWKYPDAESFDLRQALSEHHGVPFDSIVIGAGIDGLLGSLVRLTVGPGDRVVTSRGAYPTFNYHVAGYGGEIATCDYRDDHEDPDALVALARQTGAKLIYLSNPDNPMGTWHEAGRVARMIAAVPGGCLLVLDEAYAECSDQDTAPAMDPSDRRVIRLRTFSKAYGLAGARMGYAIGHPDLIAAFERVRNHFGLSRVSQAGALAALRDRDYLSLIRGRIAESRARIAAIGQDHGFAAVPSAANFVALDMERDGAFSAAVVASMGRRGVFVRKPAVAPLDRCLRVSCGGEAEMALFAAALPQALDDARAAHGDA
ncbi:pyridoxal phosphate-dependent aminotransferase [Palleronia rufa]|uniref:pyridoxal phosphate-dependent aminotransferase n=1 Tax=Palleronia rufa TaxID=1530186 RepID=UPI00056BDFD9|nr:pyridoxal phosphate-dependent aminotransferase [Palleronia rufa]